MCGSQTVKYSEEYGLSNITRDLNLEDVKTGTKEKFRRKKFEVSGISKLGL